MNRSFYRILKTGGRSVVIRDEGGKDDMSVTSDAERVVEELFLNGHLKEGVQLYYRHFDGRMDQILHSGGVFVGFAQGPEDGKVPQ